MSAADFIVESPDSVESTGWIPVNATEQATVLLTGRGLDDIDRVTGLLLAEIRERIEPFIELAFDQLTDVPEEFWEDRLIQLAADVDLTLGIGRYDNDEGWVAETPARLELWSEVE